MSAEAVNEIAKRVGPDVMHVEDAQDGWPGLATIQTDTATHAVAVFTGTVGLSHRDRDHVERRFQNPGQNRPIVVPPGRIPLLLGLWEEDPYVDVVMPVLYVADPWRRVGRVTRFSVFASLAQLIEASHDGWTDAVSGSGETITYFHPSLLPVYLDALVSEVPIPATAARTAVEATGLADLEALPPEERAPFESTVIERARRATSALVRDARFSRDVLDAYGRRCALCGLGINLVQGAHIYPASAPGSSEDVRNGVALCNNHHAAFDRHLIWIDPESRTVHLRPDVVALADHDPACAAFVVSTQPVLSEPGSPALRPLDEMFVLRYDYFAPLYDWAG